MKTAVIVGGRLQGLETLYLAKKAHIHTTLIDKDEAPIGQNFCNRFIQKYVIQYGKELLPILKTADIVLPALENPGALEVLVELKKRHGINLIHDPEAYAISSSKLRSDEVLAAAGIPVPEHYPKGRFPYIAKPSSMSGSEGVVRLNNPEELEVFLANHSREKVVIEEFLEGPSYSIEVIGTPGNYNIYHITELFMDKDYDCKRVLSCPELPETLKNEFEDIARKIGEIVKLHGIMDVEVIENKGVLKVLEIDARHPSQTPINIYHATGANFMAEIHRIFCPHSDFPAAATEKASYVSLEQIMVDETAINILGEHIITKATGLHWVKDFCGADEAMTNYRPTSKSWVATMICKAPTRRALAAKRENMFREIGKTMGCSLPVADYFPSDN